MSTINDRLKRFLFEKKLTHKQVSRALDINDQQFNNWCACVKPSIDGLEKIIRHFPDLSARWLMTGEGNMYCIENSLKKSKRFSEGEGQDDFQKLLMRLDYDINEMRQLNPLVEELLLEIKNMKNDGLQFKLIKESMGIDCVCSSKIV
jgi:hypothetical protein